MTVASAKITKPIATSHHEYAVNTGRAINLPIMPNTPITTEIHHTMDLGAFVLIINLI